MELDHIPPMPIDLDDGYMHFSTGDQLATTLSLYFAGQQDVVILAVKTALVSPALKWEPSRGGALFPHLYAPLEKAQIDWHETVNISSDGKCILPDRVV